MMISTWTFTSADLERLANIIRIDMIYHFYRKDIIDEDTLNDYESNYAYIVRRPSFFGKVWTKFFDKKNEKDDIRYILVKQASLGDIDDLNEPVEQKNYLQVVESKPEDKKKE